MRFLRFSSRRRIEDLSSQRVFVEASGLAQLRLEQCIADLKSVRATADISFNSGGAEATQETDPGQLAGLTDELLGAMEEEKRQADASLRLTAEPSARLKKAA